MMQQIRFRAMGCHVTAIVDDETIRTKNILTLVPEWFESWEQTLSRFRLDSELKQLNHSNGRPFIASDTLWEVTRLALLAARASDGLVTPAILPALVSAGYTQDFDQIKNQTVTSGNGQFKNNLNINDIHMNSTEHAITLPPAMQLDFGGIAKGWAAQRAADMLRAFGPSLVNVGGDLAITAQPRELPAWLIGINDPMNDKHDFLQIYVRVGAVATSGKDYRQWKTNGAIYHHIIDPRTQIPAKTDVLTSTVIAPTAPLAEIAAKVILILGSEKGLEWIRDKKDHAALIITETGDTKQTRNFNFFLKKPASRSESVRMQALTPQSIQQ